MSSINNINNQLKNPCLNWVANKMINSTLKNTITDILQNTFNVSDKLNVSFQESTANNFESWTQPGTLTNGVLNEIIYLNPNMLFNSNTNMNASQEYIASLLIHEIIHTYLDVNTTLSGNLQQHTEMLKGYIDKMAASLQGFYPNITLQQARSLSLQGLGSDVTSSSAFSSLLSQYGFNRDPSSPNNYANYAQQFQTNNIGTNCNDANLP
jgi:hypothetical protein